MEGETSISHLNKVGTLCFVSLLSPPPRTPGLDRDDESGDLTLRLRPGDTNEVRKDKVSAVGPTVDESLRAGSLFGNAAKVEDFGVVPVREGTPEGTADPASAEFDLAPRSPQKANGKTIEGGSDKKAVTSSAPLVEGLEKVVASLRANGASMEQIAEVRTRILTFAASPEGVAAAASKEATAAAVAAAAAAAAAPPSSPSNSRLLHVELPDGVEGGDQLLVDIPGEGRVVVPVPANAGPKARLEIQGRIGVMLSSGPDAPEPGEVVLLETPNGTEVPIQIPDDHPVDSELLVAFPVAVLDQTKESGGPLKWE